MAFARISVFAELPLSVFEDYLLEDGVMIARAIL